MKKQKMVLVGLGLTDSHGHKRITRGDDFVLTGGNEETHAGMQERAIKFSERLKKKVRLWRSCNLKRFVTC